MERQLLNGTYTTLHEENTTDVFLNIVLTFLRGFEYELGEKYDLSYLVNAKDKSLRVSNNNNIVFDAHLIECKKIGDKRLFDKEKAMKNYNISVKEWDAVIANDPALKIEEPKKRVYGFNFELMYEDEDKELIVLTSDLLKELN